MQTELGGYQIDTTHQKVLKNGQPVKWGDKANRLFILLLQAAPQTISKEKIFNEVWKGRVVTENTLYKTIGQIRSELENNDLSLESVFGEGYRLIEDASLNAGSSHTVFKTSKLQKLIAILFIIVLCTGFGVYWHKQKEQLLISKMTELEGVLAVAKKSFMSQAARRNELGELLSQRFDLMNHSFTPIRYCSGSTRLFSLFLDLKLELEYMKYLIATLTLLVSTPFFAQKENNHHCYKRDAFTNSQLKSNSLSIAQIAETERYDVHFYA
ncbi:MAG: winged helix-turn-helix domain-containing protein, partial [Proteobacteria bacterium]|nr:winged helix-turn-helix domain-containing protein [Pseudomonadota bacterium]